MKQVPCWESTNIRRHRSKFSLYGDLAPRIVRHWCNKQQSRGTTISFNFRQFSTKYLFRGR